MTPALEVERQRRLPHHPHRHPGGKDAVERIGGSGDPAGTRGIGRIGEHARDHGGHDGGKRRSHQSSRCTPRRASVTARQRDPRQSVRRKRERHEKAEIGTVIRRHHHPQDDHASQQPVRATHPGTPSFGQNPERQHRSCSGGAEDQSSRGRGALPLRGQPAPIAAFTACAASRASGTDARLHGPSM